MAPNMGRLTSLQTLEFFNVGEENGRGIEELGFMENLKGSLSIRNLELVKGKEEAASAKLFQKKKLTTLALNWGSTTGRNNDNWEDVLEGLEPCPGLQELKISNYMGARCPGWLGKLSELEVLKLYSCKNMRELGYSGDVGFPKLKTLFIWGCRQLSSVRTSFPIVDKLHLASIQVSAARDIISKIPTNSLQELSLGLVSGMTCLSDVIESSLSSCLRRLVIIGCDELTEIPSSTLECCTCLEELQVTNCPELVSCPLNLQQTLCLSSIEISDCPKLFTRDAVLPRGFEHLTNLKTLWIGPDNSEQSIDWEGLRKGCSTTLRHLTMFRSCRTQLPQQLQDFSALVYLGLHSLDSLERLPGWLGKLTSLKDLGLGNCPKLEHLPTDAIRSLTNLQVLDIYDCPLLRETQGDEIEALPNLKVHWGD